MSEHAHKIEKKTSASYDLQLIQTIPREQLKAMREAYAFMLAAIDNAIAGHAAREKQTAKILDIAAENHREHDRQCIIAMRLQRRGISLAAIKRLTGGNQHTARAMAAHGRKLAAAKLTAAKKAKVLELYGKGHGPRPISRMLAHLGKISPSNVAKIIKADKLKNQRVLHFPPVALK